jgi:DNA-binding HxlR family transcriptional regulator
VTRAFSEALREGRCRPARRFARDVGSAATLLSPLAAAWNLEILFLLYIEGPSRFSDLKRALSGVSSRVLTDKLRALEQEGLLARGSPTYRVTPRGEVVARHLHPIVYYLRHAPATSRRVP